MVGHCMTLAPSSVRLRARPLACSRARVTTMLRPNSGRCSNQSSRSCREQTLPTTMTEGLLNLLSTAAWGRVAMVATRLRWWGVVPR